MLNSFHSVLIETPDLEEGLRDYAQLLGLPLPRIEVNAARQTRCGVFSLENMRLELRTSGPEEAPDAVPGLAGFRLSGLDSAAIDAGLAGRGLRPVRSETETYFEAKAVGASGGTQGHEPSRSYHVFEIDREQSRGLRVELVSDEKPEWEPLLPANLGSPDPAGVFGLDHVVVYSGAPDLTRRFYEEALGIRLALDRTFEERGVRLLFFRIGGATIEIGGKLDAPIEAERLDRFGGLAWKVRDIDAIASRLSAAGVDVSEVRDGFKAGTRVCTLRDHTQGIPTLLIEPVKS